MLRLSKEVSPIKIKKKDWQLLSQVLMASAVVSVVLSAIGYTGTDLWLASTQWLLVAIVLALFGLYCRMNS